MPKILSLLSLSTGMGPITLARVINNAPKSYKTFYIPKRNGDAREISQPTAELKLVQRALSDVYLQTLPCHDAAKAYRPGGSIRDNATPHAGLHPIVKFDFKDFFPSINENDWTAYCIKRGELDSTDIDLTARILFMRPKRKKLLRLSIGAPSSPILSNLIMYEFDEMLTNVLSKSKITYTRYADDLTFSAPRTGYLHDVEPSIRYTLKSIEFPRLRLNEEKTKLATARYSRRVTGLTLSNDGRVTIGRDRKRWIRSAINHYRGGTISDDDREKLSGLIAFAKGCEPEYFRSLLASYERGLVEFIMKIPARRQNR